MAIFHHTLFSPRSKKTATTTTTPTIKHKHNCQPRESLASQSGALPLGHHICKPHFINAGVLFCSILTGIDK